MYSSQPIILFIILSKCLLLLWGLLVQPARFMIKTLVYVDRWDKKVKQHRLKSTIMLSIIQTRYFWWCNAPELWSGNFFGQ